MAATIATTLSYIIVLPQTYYYYYHACSRVSTFEQYEPEVLRPRPSTAYLRHEHPSCRDLRLDYLGVLNVKAVGGNGEPRVLVAKSFLIISALF